MKDSHPIFEFLVCHLWPSLNLFLIPLMLMRQTKNYSTSKYNNLSPHVFPCSLLPHLPFLCCSRATKSSTVFENLMTVQVLDNNQLSALIRGSEPSLTPLGKVLGIHNSWSTTEMSVTQPRCSPA